MDHLLDNKVIHYCPSRYSAAHVTLGGDASCCQHRAGRVAAEYTASARSLDARFFAHIADVDQRPVLTRLRQYPDPRGLVFGAFAEASADVHTLLRLVAEAASLRHWREAGARSALGSRSTFTCAYRRQWGCEVALQGARLRISRSFLVDGAGAAPHGGADDAPREFGGFDPRSPADIDRAQAPPLGGLPAGQRF